ncbi:MAG TPA: carboxypeptidase-like regulatory domain-containing protein [Candidatus Polarisedimenticolia bacterium]|nr:carboxypeptidase-like regulatory domain-containing protein [Candidatus Polarisedimenticolia bacterium]
MSQGHFGSPCDNKNLGDVTVVYDAAADRWFISDFAFALDANSVPVAPYYQCFAVSRSGDPVSGGWNFYSLQTSDLFPDYPKIGIWPDGLYLTANMFLSTTFKNTRVWALNKDQMEAGVAASAQMFNLPGRISSSDVYTTLPSTYHPATGTPPAGRENLLASIWSAKVARVWKLHVDWTNPVNSTLAGPSNVALSTWGVAPASVPAKDGNNLDTLFERLMMQNQYTNLRGTESIWLTQTVAATTINNAAVRWYQLDVTGGTVITSGPLQQSTFDNGNDGLSRFMPSLAVDKNLDMGIGYSVSSSTLFPAIRYAGRLASDPPGTLGQSETSLIEGSASQCCTFSDGSSNSRWGDYSAMVLDPDGCTFWYTNEYYAAPQPVTLSQDQWLTRIGSFHFAGCFAPGKLQGTVINATTGSPIGGAIVTAGTNTTATDGSGFYLFSGLDATAYTVTATAPGFSGAPVVVTVPSGGTAVQDFALSPNLSGCLTDTSQGDFQAGAAAGLDLTTHPGDVSLALAGSAGIDQQQTTTVSFGLGTTATTWSGQGFVPAVGGALTSLDLQIFLSSGTAGPVTVEIRNNSGGVPGSTVLATGSTPTVTSGAGTPVTVNFSPAATLTAGTTYHFILKASSAGTYGAVIACKLSPGCNLYTGGSAESSTNSGGSWSAQPTDLYFITHMSPVNFVTSGNLVSSLKDANPAPSVTPHWTALSFTATAPAGTTVRFQAAGSDNPSGPFNFVGPDGTGATFFTTSGASLSRFDGNRYLKYEAFLATTDTTRTPTLSDVTLCYANGCTGAPDGTACDDGNPCTTGEVCSGGACGGGILVAPPEVNDSVRVGDGGSSSTITWNDLPGIFNVYHGSRAQGDPWAYSQTCLAASIPVMNASDTTTLPVSTLFFYLVTRVDACGESIPGRDSAGQPIPNSFPCP